MKFLLVTMISVFLTFLTACDPSAQGFSLPAGDPEAGKIVYTTMQCNSCHKLPGIDQLPATDESTISVNLGGKVSKTKTYGELITSVINPSHRIARRWELQNTDDAGKSSMRNYNEVMTVSELVDLVTFLKSKYELKSYPQTVYPYYVYPG